MKMRKYNKISKIAQKIGGEHCKSITIDKAAK